MRAPLGLLSLFFFLISSHAYTYVRALGRPEFYIYSVPRNDIVEPEESKQANSRRLSVKGINIGQSLDSEAREARGYCTARAKTKGSPRPNFAISFVECLLAQGTICSGFHGPSPTYH